MKVTLKKIGNSTGLILPKELLERLGYEQGDELRVKQGPGNQLILDPTKDEIFEKGLKIAEEGMRKYDRALKELAK